MNILTLSAKNCMSHLLLKDTFDHFSFIEGEITTFNTFTIDGKMCGNSVFRSFEENGHRLASRLSSLLLRKTLQTSSLNTKSADSVRRIFRECI